MFFGLTFPSGNIIKSKMLEKGCLTDTIRTIVKKSREDI
jgi:hypothetical protein